MLETSELSPLERRIRILYLAVRDDIDQAMLDYSLLQSYQAYKEKNIEFPFPEKRELKPGAKIPRNENEIFNEALVFLLEGHLPNELRKYIRTKRSTRLTKENLNDYLVDRNLTESLIHEFEADDRIVSGTKFMSILKKLATLDSALLIQKDTKTKSRYILTDFFVSVNYNIIEIVESLAKNLKYISRNIHEKEEDEDYDMEFAENLESKFLEYFCFPSIVGRRREAAAVAAYLFNQLDFMGTVYVSSNEERSLIRLCEEDLSRATLLKLTSQESQAIEQHYNVNIENYAIDAYNGNIIIIFNTIYEHTDASRPPQDSKQRKGLNPKKLWIRVKNQLITPPPNKKDLRPIPFYTIYDPENPFVKSTT